MAQFPIGKVIPNYKGRYKEGIYEELDIVAHNNGTWVSMTNNNTTEPSEDNTKWRLVCDNSNQLVEDNLKTFALALEVIGKRLEDLTNKIDQNQKDIAEQHGLVLDSINSTAFVRTKLNEFGSRLSKIEKKLGI
nr:MAG TPA: hypothetical protein [Caudoviricetes sp.]